MKKHIPVKIYHMQLLPNNQQQNQISFCNFCKGTLFNFTDNFNIHFFHNYVCFLKKHHVNSMSKLMSNLGKKGYNKSQRKDYKKKIYKIFFPKWTNLRDWFSQVYIKLPRKNQCYTYNEKLDFLNEKGVPAHTKYHGIYDAVVANTNWHTGKQSRPHRKGNYSRCNIYFDGSIKVSGNEIKLPDFSWMKIAESNYAPNSSDLKVEGFKYTKAYVGENKNSTRYYVTLVSNQPVDISQFSKRHLFGRIGIDVGILAQATINKKRKNGSQIFRNYSKDIYYQRLEKGIQDAEHAMSRRPYTFRKQQSKLMKNNKRARRKPSDYTSGYIRAKEIFEKRNQRAKDYIHGHLRAMAFELVKAKPKSITIENLNIKGMMQNHNLARAIARASWGYFYKWLEWFCVKYGIQLRRVSRWFASTKECCRCHKINDKQLKGQVDLGARVLHCPYCGLIINRDLNAAINLANCKNYQVWKKNKHGEYQWI